MRISEYRAQPVSAIYRETAGPQIPIRISFGSTLRVEVSRRPNARRTPGAVGRMQFPAGVKSTLFWTAQKVQMSDTPPARVIMICKVAETRGSVSCVHGQRDCLGTRNRYSRASILWNGFRARCPPRVYGGIRLIQATGGEMFRLQDSC